MLLNQAKFIENGGIESGFVLKPEWMRLGTKILQDFQKVQMALDLHIICGYNLRPEIEDYSDIIDPFLKVSIRGV